MHKNEVNAFEAIRPLNQLILINRVSAQLVSEKSKGKRRKVGRYHTTATMGKLEVNNCRNQLASKEENHYLLIWNANCKILRQSKTKKHRTLYQQIWVLV